MPRLMSVAMTEQAVRDRTKTVTRRKGWLMLAPGDRLTLCAKVQGRKPAEVAREGFPGMDPIEFMRRFFIEAQGVGLMDEITRIEWRYIEDGDS